MRVLAVSAHPDDAELGAAGALLRHAAQGDAVTLLVMTEGEVGPQAFDPRRVEEEQAARLLGAQLRWGNLSDTSVRFDREAVDVVERAISDVRPDLIYTHAGGDSHQDHQATGQATIAAARHHARVLGFESLSTLRFAPTLYIEIDDALPGKLEVLRTHQSQVLGCALYDLDAVVAMARQHAFHARLRGKYAEAFEVIRFEWDLSLARVDEPNERERAGRVEEVAR
jgi:LmbE family N-acetylglucosaminyl deacetylase